MRDCGGMVIMIGDRVVYAAGRSAGLKLKAGTVVADENETIAVRTDNGITVTLRVSARVLVL